MIIVISAQHSDLNAFVDSRFGRAPFFILHNTKTGTWKAIENPAIAQTGGAGVAAAQFIIDREAKVVISGDFGPNASRALQASGIKMYRFTESIKTVKDAIDKFNQNALLPNE